MVRGDGIGPGQLHEDIVEGWPSQAHIDEFDTDAVQVTKDCAQGLGSAAHRHRDLAALLSDPDHSGGMGFHGRPGAFKIAMVGNGDLEMFAADQPFEFIGTAARDRVAVVDHHDVVGELVGFFEVLGGQQHRGARRNAVTDDLPQFAAAARVQSGRRLIEEEHRWFGNQCTGEVESTSHSARVGARRPVGGIGESEHLEQLARPRTHPSARQSVQPTDHHQVLESGQVFIDRRVLAREADQLAHPTRIGEHIDPGDGGRSGIGCHQSGQDRYRRGLAGTVGAQQSHDGARRYLEVETVEGGHRAVALDQAHGAHREIVGAHFVDVLVAGAGEYSTAPTLAVASVRAQRRLVSRDHRS